jgi:hypothetical protein
VSQLKKVSKKREHFRVGTCFDDPVTKKLQERLPSQVPFLNFKDLRPEPVQTEEYKRKKQERF